MHTANQNNANDTERLNAKSILRVTSVLFGVLGIALFIPLLMSVMAFDAPGSEKRITTWIVFLCLFSFSPICILSIVVSWSLYGFKRFRLAKIVAFFPLINVSILFIFFSVAYIIDIPDQIASTSLKKQIQIQRKAQLDKLCNNDLIQIYKKAENATTLYFPNDSIFESSLILEENFKFVEIRYINKYNSPEYKRIVKNLDWKEGSSPLDQIKREDIDHPEAKYELDFIHLYNENKLGITLREYKVKNRSNGQLLAHYKIVNAPERNCPAFDPSGYQLLKYVLGSMKENEMKAFENKLLEYKKAN
jgi:hypothetical protein